MKKRLKRTLSAVVAVTICLSVSFAITSCKKKQPVSSTSGKGSSTASSEASAVLSGAISAASSAVSAQSSILKQYSSGSGSGQGASKGASVGSTVGLGIPGTKTNFDPYASIPKNLKGSTVNILLWYTPSATEKQIYANFTAKTGIKVNPVPTSYTLYPTKVATNFASGNATDVVCMSAAWFPSFIKKNLVKDISAGTYDLKNDPMYDISLMNQLKWNNKYYAVALKGSTVGTDLAVMLFNATKFKAAHRSTPYQEWKAGKWNWNTFLADARAMTGKSNGTSYYGYGASNIALFMQSANSNYVKLSTANGKTKVINNLSDPNLAKAWEFFNSLVTTYNVAPSTSGVGDFISGRVAMYGEDQWVMQSDGDVNKKMTDEWGAVPFPGPAGSAYVVPAQVKGWCIANGAKNPKGASYFLRYFLDPSNMSTNIWGKGDDDLNSVFASMVESNKCADISQGIVGYNTTNDYFSIQGTLGGSSSPDQIPTLLAQFSSRLNGILGDVNK